MPSSDSMSTSSNSESTESERSRDRRLHDEGTSSGVVTSGMPMEIVREVREDPPEELEESNWPVKGGYGWVAVDVRDQSSLFRWSRLLNSWLNCTPVISKGVSGVLFLWRGLVLLTGYAMGRRRLPKSVSTCICATFLNFMCDCR